MKFFSNKRKGVSLAEMVIAIGLLGFILSSLSVFAMDANRILRSTEKKIEAYAYMNEVFQAIQLKKLESWATFIQSTGTGPKHLTRIGNTYTLADGSESKNGITISFEIQNAFRDTNGNLVTTGGTMDKHTRTIVVNASWTTQSGAVKSASSRTYVTDWNILKFRQTTQSEFDTGTKDRVMTTNFSGGEVTLDTYGKGNWCSPGATATTLDLPGSGVASGIVALEGKAFTGTGGNASGISFADINISNTAPPVATLGGQLDGYKTNDVFTDGTYYYISTDTNSSEIVIFSKSGSTYTPVGTFDASGTSDGTSVFVTANRGYMTQGNILRIFDLTTKTGARTQLGSINLAGTGRKVRVVGDYAYVTIQGSSSRKLEIVNIANPTSPSIVGYANPGPTNGVEVVVNDTATRAYLALANNTNGAEMYILDISTKTGSRPTVGSYETSGMDPTGIALVPGNRAIVVGKNGEEYQVINTTNESSLIRCGGINIDSGINGVSAVLETDNDAYAYIVTGDSGSEFKAIEGGPGAGGSGAYTTSGTFTSPVLDTGNSAPTFISMDWIAQVPGTTTCRLQIRVADSAAAITSATFTGPTGPASYFTDSVNTYLNSIPDINKRYIQYRVFFESDGGLTPQLEEVAIHYQI